MFKKFKGRPDWIVEFGRRWANRLFYGSLGVSLLIVLSFSEAEVHHNVFFTEVFRVVSGAVPAVHRMYSVSHHPAYAGAIFALNWLLVPFYFVLTCMAYKFWNDEVMSPIMQRLADDKRRIKWLLIPFFSMYFLMDWQVIPGAGIYSMALYQMAHQYGIYAAFDAYPITVAVMYWGMCVAEGMFYGFGVTFLAWYVRKRIAIAHRIERHL